MISEGNVGREDERRGGDHKIGKNHGRDGTGRSHAFKRTFIKMSLQLKKLKCFVYELDVHVFVPKTHFKLLYQLNTNA